MRLIPFCSLLLMLLVFASCEQPEDPVYPYVAKVLGINSDCRVYEIQFLSKLEEIENKFGNSAVTGIYIGKNLPDELKVINLIIRLNCRKPLPSEIGLCTCMGPSYNWVYIINAKIK